MLARVMAQNPGVGWALSCVFLNVKVLRKLFFTKALFIFNISMFAFYLFPPKTYMIKMPAENRNRKK
jgi:hypothetical protein